MIPAAFDYVRARSADEAFTLLQQHRSDARVLAGGQSLIPAMRFRLARPAVLIDINHANNLGGMRLDDDSVVIGAIARRGATCRARFVEATASVVAARR